MGSVGWVGEDLDVLCMGVVYKFSSVMRGMSIKEQHSCPSVGLLSGLFVEHPEIVNCNL